MNERYKVLHESHSNHCCFEFTVVDMTGYRPVTEDDGTVYDHHDKVICECFEQEHADRIAFILNEVDKAEQFVLQQFADEAGDNND